LSKISIILICDDIRQEVGGKQSLMGIYNDVIIFGPSPEGVPAWPKLMRLGFFIRLSFNEDEKIPEGTTFLFSFRRGDESVQIARGQFIINEQTRVHFANLVIMANPFVINGPGEIKFSLLLLDAQGKAFKTFGEAGSIRIEQRV
jgi:hypothetical protein